MSDHRDDRKKEQKAMAIPMTGVLCNLGGENIGDLQNQTALPRAFTAGCGFYLKMQLIFVSEPSGGNCVAHDDRK